VKLYTSRYYDPRWKSPGATDGLAMVRITVGKPKHPLPYPLAAHIRELTPYKAFRVKDPDQYRRLYLERLEHYGVETIRQQLLKVSTANDDADLVLLCFEDVLLPGEWCHRRIFADWWFEQTGETVEELATPPDKPQQLKLW
jgi:hypothetical protein